MQIDRQPTPIAIRDVIAAWAVCLALGAAGLLYPVLDSGEELSIEAQAAALAGPAEPPVARIAEPATGGTTGSSTALCEIGKPPVGHQTAEDHPAGRHDG